MFFFSNSGPYSIKGLFGAFCGSFGMISSFFTRVSLWPRLEEDWKKMFALQNETVPAFDNNLAVHSHGDTDHLAMEHFLANGSSSYTSPDSYVRALCWLYLVDFAVSWFLFLLDFGCLYFFAKTKKT